MKSSFNKPTIKAEELKLKECLTEFVTQFCDTKIKFEPQDEHKALWEEDDNMAYTPEVLAMIYIGFKDSALRHVIKNVVDSQILLLSVSI